MNHGLHTAEAEAVISDLAEALEPSMAIRYPIEQEGHLVGDPLSLLTVRCLIRCTSERQT